MFSFTGLTKALQPESGDTKEEPSSAPTTASGAADGEQTGASAAGSGFWGFAAALSANIKQQTAEVAESFQRTSWVSELSNLADGLEKERVVLAERAHHVTDRLGHAMPEQASRVTKVAAQQLSSTLTALRAEVAHGGAEIADGVGALLGKPVAARPRSPSPASKRDAAAPPPLVQALLAEPDGAQDFEAWAREHAEFPSDRISAAREADPALAFAYVCLAQRHQEEEGVGWDSPDEAEEEEPRPHLASEAVSGTSSPSSVEPATALAREEGPHDAQGDKDAKKEEEDEDDWGDDWE
ncbi:hypothetical protein QBZ16_000056 [Prototheca wickerhamii]|uniref:BSD domain-containing protein n=1 Tax=Prototheca wickerhamii TaxID=3111 RepID=A0AAD9IM74_PROWI|nr:hypothetical protein QBZ16_000056 [Prototheca wickerhamii]